MEKTALSFISLVTFGVGALAVSAARKHRERLASAREKAGAAAAEMASLRKRAVAQAAVEATGHSMLQMAHDLAFLQEALAEAAIPPVNAKTA
ncbi:MAG: hypothetical protein ACK6DY_16540 [Acidobacteriota bacterium]|jgi:hypothetical protein|nr:hypothetical protein [Bryobacteraceae bacterium CoA2 C42]MCA2963578.1 hypothetical protein [Acidobacteriaceae bacterium]